MNCNVTNILCKRGSFVVVLQVCCKIPVVVLPSCSHYSSFFSPLFFSLSVSYAGCSRCLYFFPHTVLYLAKKYQNEPFLKIKRSCLVLNCIKCFSQYVPLILLFASASMLILEQIFQVFLITLKKNRTCHFINTSEFTSFLEQKPLVFILTIGKHVKI